MPTDRLDLPPEAYGATAAHELCDLHEEGATRSELRRHLRRARARFETPASRRRFMAGLSRALEELRTDVPDDASVRAVSVVASESAALSKAVPVAVLALAAAVATFALRPSSRDVLADALRTDPVALSRTRELGGWPTDPYLLKGSAPVGELRFTSIVLRSARAEVERLAAERAVHAEVEPTGCARLATDLGAALGRLRVVALLSTSVPIPAPPAVERVAACAAPEMSRAPAHALERALIDWPRDASTAEAVAQRALRACAEPSVP